MTHSTDILRSLPAPTGKPVSVRVAPAAERAIRHGHPWVFDQAITHQNRDGQSGDLAVIYRNDRQFVGLGLFDPDSTIRIRVIHQGKPATIDQAWFDDRVRDVMLVRQAIEATTTTGYRLIHGENDQMPGLIADRYDRTLVIKLYTAAWIPHLNHIARAIEKVFAFDRVVLRLSRAVQSLGQSRADVLHGMSNGMVLQGEPLTGPVLFTENGLTFEADPVHGHKTGFFLDQRDNRARVQPLTAGKDVLNVFAYSGGFSLYAARGGAKRVVSLDISQPALDAAARHFELNDTNANVAAAEHELLCGDAFELLIKMADRQQTFDVVIIDPPAFATKQAHVERAIEAYEKLTCLGLDVLSQDGTIVLASCSSRMDADTFFRTVHRAAKRIGRPLNETRRTGHAIDHPIGFKEGEYLKCLFATA